MARLATARMLSFSCIFLLLRPSRIACVEPDRSALSFVYPKEKLLSNASNRSLSSFSVKIEPSNNLSPDTRAKLKQFVGNEVDEAEIKRCTQRVEKLVGGLAATVDCRKIAIATKVKMAVNAPKQNVINMITNSYPKIITDRMAANIFDALAES